MKTRTRYIRLVDGEPARLSYTEEGDVCCGVDRLDGIDESLVRRKMQGHGALHQA